MDKRNTLIGVLLLAAALVLMTYTSRRTAPAPPAPPASAPSPTDPASPSVSVPGPTPAPAANTPFAALASDSAEATYTTLENEFVSARFTDFGGAVRDVAFKKYQAEVGKSDPYVFNAQHADPILAFTESSLPGIDRQTRFRLTQSSATEVVYTAVFENRVEITRRYVLAAPGDGSRDPYRIRHETTLRNLTDQTVTLPSIALALGTTALVSSNDYGQFLTVSAWDGEEKHYTERSELEGGGFWASLIGNPRPVLPVIEKPANVVWGTVTNQFFASLYTPDAPGTAVITRRVELAPFPGTNRPNTGVAGSARFNLPALAPGASTLLAGELYVGPKEYTRLKEFSKNEAKVMQFDRFFFNRIFLSGVFAPLMNTLMNWTHSLVGNWGWAIVLMTLLLKVVTLPLTLSAARSGKRMAKLQPLMQEIREKYKSNPQKAQMETLRIFKENKVNPLGGCIPILITIPLFIGFFAMLQGTAELRYQNFLWVNDLSAPDTVARLPLGFMTLPLNIMPLLMGATMIMQMRLTPMPSADKLQVQMFKIMPVIFTLFCYNFAAALALYSTINGLFTIGQQLIINRMKDPEPAVVAAKPGPSGRPLKNVTPGRKLK